MKTTAGLSTSEVVLYLEEAPLPLKPYTLNSYKVPGVSPVISTESSVPLYTTCSPKFCHAGFAV